MLCIVGDSFVSTVKLDKDNITDDKYKHASVIQGHANSMADGRELHIKMFSRPL